MKTINKYGYTYEIECKSIDEYFMTATNPMNGYTVEFYIQNLRTTVDPADYWRGQVAEYNLDGYGFAYEIFIGELFADIHEEDDEELERVIDNCQYAFARWMSYIATAEEDHYAK